jgi:hypothetical protein
MPGFVTATDNPKKYQPGDLVFVVIGKGEDIREDLEKYGAITETPISAPRFTP